MKKIITAALLTSVLVMLAGCTGQPLTGEQAEGYAKAAHTIVHGGIEDYKEVRQVQHTR